LLERQHFFLVSPRAASRRRLRALRETPILVHAGGSETLLDTILDFCDEASAAGADIRARVFEREVHAFAAFGFSPSWPDAAADIREFCDRALD